MQVQVREMSDEDLDVVLAINQAEVPRVGTLTPERLRQIVGWADVALVAEVGSGSTGQLAGFCLTMGAGTPYDSTNYLWFKARYREFLYVDRVAVAAEHRRLGVASTLYDEALRRNPAPVVTAEVNVDPPNPDSLAFHERRGFVEVGRKADGTKTVAMLARVV